jgi:hypothetical protein
MIKIKTQRRVDKRVRIVDQHLNQPKRQGSILMLSGAVFLALTTIAGLAINIAYIELVRSKQSWRQNRSRHCIESQVVLFSWQLPISRSERQR